MKNKSFYKSKHPYQTINEIRQILYKVGVFVSESSASHGNFYHSHLTITSDNLGDLYFMTNGKGVTPEYSLASAYAEFMERLQNSFLFTGQYGTKAFCRTLSQSSSFIKKMKKENLELDYVIAPDEVSFTLKDYLSSKLTFNVIDDKNTRFIVDSNNSELMDKYQVICIPYTNVFTGEKKYLPACNPHTGSNGMCAGNTPDEALVQGFCELFERFAIKQVFLENVIPPRIPLEFFAGTPIFERIKSHPELEVIVFDCSMKKGFPVIGVLILDKEKKLYRFEFGAATTPSIALERCLTEHFQSPDVVMRMQPLFSKTLYPGRSETEIKYINYYHQLTTAEGELDVKSFLSSSPSYGFDGFSFIEGNNHHEELLSIKKLLERNHMDCFIRDSSLLGFPAFHIYIPSFSNCFELLNNDDIYHVFLNELYSGCLLNLKDPNGKENLYKFCLNRDQMLDKVHSYTYNPAKEFLFNTNPEYRSIDVYLMMATLFLYCSDTEKAQKYLTKFILKEKSTEPEADLSYYECAQLYLSLYNKNFALNEIKDQLSLLFPDELVDEVLSDVVESSKALNYYSFPSCFDCDSCPVTEYCHYFDVMKTCSRIQQSSKLPNLDLFDLFKEEAEKP